MDIVRMILSQAREPSGRFGRLGAQRMNRGHRRLAQWGLSQVTVGRETLILDVGCGGGGTVRRLAELAPEGRVYGVDFSEASVAASRRTNRALINAGRVEIKHGSVSALPFPDEMFDLVTAIQTHFFWPDLLTDLQEVRRVLRPCGTVAIVSSALRLENRMQANNRWSDLVRIEYHCTDGLRELMSAAEFAEISSFEQRAKGWTCVTGMKST